jgi:hypothetical protein
MHLCARCCFLFASCGVISSVCMMSCSEFVNLSDHVFGMIPLAIFVCINVCG